MFLIITRPIFALIAIVPSTLLFISIFCSCALGQYSVVRKISAETLDGIRVSAWTRRQQIKLNQYLTIDYEIKNRNTKPIYFVRKQGKLEIFVSGDTIELPFSVMSSGDSSDYYYNFAKILPGKSYAGCWVIPPEVFNKEQTWRVNIGFAFVTNSAGLIRKIIPGEDPAPYREALNERVRIIGINGLIVEVDDLDTIP